MFYGILKVNEHQPTLYLIGQELQSVLFIHRTCFVHCISHGFIQLKLLNKSSIGTKSKRQQTRRCKYTICLKCCQIQQVWAMKLLGMLLLCACLVCLSLYLIE